MHALYTLGIRLYVLMIRLAVLFQPKAAMWYQGRKNWEQQLHQALEAKRKPGQILFWIHSASLGEFEQGRPLIEALKSQHPEVFILLTFFSPSGYEIRKQYPLADHICYLPADLPRAARAFVRIAQPQLAVFVKYEFWYNYLQELQRKNIPTWLIAALFRPEQPFFQVWGKWYLKILQGFDHFFVQNQASAALLQRFGISQYTLAGDPRIDRVLNIAMTGKAFPLIEMFKDGNKVLVAGSTWAADEDLLAQLWQNQPQTRGWKLIIAPHEIDSNHLSLIEQKFPGQCIRYSRFEAMSEAPFSVLIMDNIGMLSALYRYAELAYIGGGFGKGIHNTLEPMAFGLPVLFGPKYQKFAEAVAVVSLGGAFVVQSTADLLHTFEQLNVPAFQSKAAHAVKLYLEQNQGATAKISSALETRFF